MNHVRPSLWFWLAFSITWLMIGTARAETNAEKIFGPWFPVTPETIGKAVPDLVHVGLPGSVQRYRKTEIVGCSIRDDSGRVVGWSLNCFPSAPRGGNREVL